MSVASSVFSDSQAKVYAWLFGQPDRSFHLSELRRLTGLGSASLQRELSRMVNAKLVHSESRGNLRCFQANPQSPVFGELVSLTRKTLGAGLVLRQALSPLAPNLQAGWIYGSVAKQTDNWKSDVDVMLVGRDLLLGDVLACLIPAEAQLGRKINPTLLTPDEFERRGKEPDSFVNRVLSQPLIPLIGTADESA